MRRLMILCAALLLVVAMASPATAGRHDHDHEVPEHPHVLLVNFELIDTGPTDSPFDDEVAFTRCVDLANNQRLPLPAHHHSLHTGTAGFGDLTVGVTRAGHAVLPLQPYEMGLPFEDCTQIEQFFAP